ncbi:hybrid sensor histidine kinase/response regulator [Allocoleopsis franciscana]|uniref:hybrid sensor histidine kinase/response regulator n=1 Tax=Allocoleopsis franciscana TaxID=2886352 RepID=UPI001D014FBF|nr:ATP-binding protein [Allocoleopsis franciscana]
MKAKILIVEDENIVAFNIQNRLEGLGYNVTAVISSGEAALQNVEQNRPDLVLMDIKLKGPIDGIQAAEQIHRQFKIPVVYLTAYADEETLNRAKITEPYGYILKPFEARDLVTTIEMALYKHQIEQQLREREQWLATTLKSIGDAVITTDSQGLVTFMNPVAEALTRWNSEEVLGYDLTQIFHAINEKTREVIENPIKLVLQEGVTVGLENHTLLITKDGSEIPIDDSAAPIKNEAGNILGAVLVFHDITEQQQIQSVLEKTNEELEVRVAESIAQLKETNEQLRQEIARRQRLEQELRLALEKERELNELKSRIIATVSHEYRTPLTTILSSADILENYDSRLTLDKKKKHFQRIQSSIKYLTKLVEDMLIVNQAETGNLEFSPTFLNVEQIACEIVNECQVNPANPHRILFECQGSCTNVFLDEKLLKLILRNLLSNAIKFSPDRNPIRLELSCEPSQVVLRLSDQGIGILPTEKPWLFNPFFRGSNIGVTPGVGLGLVMVKECVDLHGGEILVESEVGQGTTFTVTLPM